MAEIIARVRKEMQQRLKEIESELASVEALIAERARLERALATPPFAVQQPSPAKRRKPARPRAFPAVPEPAGEERVSLTRAA